MYKENNKTIQVFNETFVECYRDEETFVDYEIQLHLNSMTYFKPNIMSDSSPWEHEGYVESSWDWSTEVEQDKEILENDTDFIDWLGVQMKQIEQSIIDNGDCFTDPEDMLDQYDLTFDEIW